MKLEEQIVSLELARKLKELGVTQESLFSWVISRHDGKTYVIDYNDSCGLCSTSYNASREGQIAAFTVAELGEMMRTGVTQRLRDKKKKFSPTAKEITDEHLGIDFVPKWDKTIKRYTYCLHLAAHDHYILDDNEANARAKMLIYLIENKLIKI